MPIRINLLAEEQAAEQMRRRDPLKRAMLAGAMLIFAMFVWIGVTQMNLRAARSELGENEARLKHLDEASKSVKAQQQQIAELDGKIKAVDRYSSNRFYWATFLDAVRHCTVDNMRLTEIRADHRYSSGDIAKLHSTTVNVPYNPPPPWWKFWASDKPAGDLNTLAAERYSPLTNAPPFTTNHLPYTVKIALEGTNILEKTLITSVDFESVPWASEDLVVEIRGRDYGSPHGAAIDEFARRVTAQAFFKEWLDSERGYRFTERPPQALPDTGAPGNPLYVPFTMELHLKQRVFPYE